MPSLVIDDFSGGLNLRDSINELAPNESPLAHDFTLDERGALNWRNGCSNVASLPGVSGKNVYIHYSEALDLWLCARETSGAPNDFTLHTRPGDLSGSWTDRGPISTDVAATCAFIDFPGNPPKVVMAVGNSGVWTYNAVGPALVNDSTTVKGTSIALWQNKAWVAGATLSDANGNPTRLYYSALGDPTTWGATTQFVDIREKDAAGLTALGVCAGALIVFKKRSTYRVNDSTTGSFSTIAAAAGAAAARCVVPHSGRLYVWSTIGLYECDGVGMRNVGDKIRPLYTSNAATTCGGALGSRLLFAYDGSGIGRPNALIEFRPSEGWCLKHLLADTSTNEITSFATKDDHLYGAAADGNVLYDMLAASVGLDNGQLASAAWRTPWFLPNSGMLSRLHRLRVQGLVGFGTTTELNCIVYRNWSTFTGDTYLLGDLLRATAGDAQRAADLQSLGHGSAFAFDFSTATAAGSVSIRALQLIDQSLAWPSPGYSRGTSRSDGPPVHSPPTA